jgi:hypothetical protein
MTAIDKTFVHFPGRRYAQAELAEALPSWLDGPALRITRQIFRRSGVEGRSMVFPPGEQFGPGQVAAP